MPRGVEASRRLLKKTKKVLEPVSAPVFKYTGKGENDYLHSIGERLNSLGSARTNSMVETLKMCAVYNRSYSLSMNQIGLLYKAFTMHRDVKDGLWVYPERSEDVPEKIKSYLKLPEHEFQIDFFNIYANPKIVAVTENKVYDWERCASFPGVKAYISRPVGIKLTYQNETGELCEQNFYDFEARMVVHEINHLQGLDLTHWSVSEGVVEFDHHTEDQHENIKKELEKYKPKIAEIKQSHKDLFNCEGKVRKVYSEMGLTWHEMDSEYPLNKPYTGKISKFNLDFLINMYDAANKDNRKEELKAKYFDQESTKGRSSADKFDKAFGYKNKTT